jgi:hypothetical protein
MTCLTQYYASPMSADAVSAAQLRESPGSGTSTNYFAPASQEANALSDTRMVLRLFRSKNLSENDGADTVRRSNVLWDHVARLTS